MAEIKKRLSQCIVISILFELLIPISHNWPIIDQIQALAQGRSDLLYIPIIGLIYAQIILYRRINLNWEKMTKNDRTFYTIVIIGILLLNPITWAIVLILGQLVIVLIILLILALLAGPIINSQREHNREMRQIRRDAELTGLREDVRNLNNEIKKL